MNDIYSTPMDFYSGEQIDSATLIGDAEPWWIVEAGSGPDGITLVWTEPMEFHLKTRRLLELVNDDGELLPRVPEILQTELRRLLTCEGVTVEVSDQDEPALEVSVPLTVEPCTVERLAEVVWPFVATLTNVTDPGTFGAEYVMGNVERILVEENQ